MSIQLQCMYVERKRYEKFPEFCEQRKVQTMKNFTVVLADTNGTFVNYYSVAEELDEKEELVRLITEDGLTNEDVIAIFRGNLEDIQEEFFTA